MSYSEHTSCDSTSMLKMTHADIIILQRDKQWFSSSNSFMFPLKRISEIIRRYFNIIVIMFLIMKETLPSSFIDYDNIYISQVNLLFMRFNVSKYTVYIAHLCNTCCNPFSILLFYIRTNKMR